jgi:hypothetical protein
MMVIRLELRERRFKLQARAGLGFDWGVVEKKEENWV